MKTITPLSTALAAFACFALSPIAQAVTPAPDGGYPGQNTAEGDGALSSITIGADFGVDNTAIGFHALFSNTTGAANTATGSRALISNTTGGDNTATGYSALFRNTSGRDNTANGSFALFSNTIGIDNTATGDSA